MYTFHFNHQCIWYKGIQKSTQTWTIDQQHLHVIANNVCIHWQLSINPIACKWNHIKIAAISYHISFTERTNKFFDWYFYGQDVIEKRQWNMSSVFVKYRIDRTLEWKAFIISQRRLVYHLNNLHKTCHYYLHTALCW